MVTHHGVREFWRLIEPIHAVTYFSPEPLVALKSAGYRGFWMGYFAGRSAPLGAASPELVHSIFYNFDFQHVARALPDAWTFASPEAALTARLSGSAAALGRLVADEIPVGNIDRAAQLASLAARSAPMEGRALFAANRTLPEPADPLAKLWLATTLLREHRGDGHVAALVTGGISGREAHVLHALATGTPTSVYATARSFTDTEWAGVLDRLRNRGLLTKDGKLSQAGHDLKAEVEDRTDALAGPAYEALDNAQRAELKELLRPIARKVSESGEIPRKSPMGLDLDELGRP